MHPPKYAVIPQYILWGGDYSILLESQWKMKFTLVSHVLRRNHENPENEMSSSTRKYRKYRK